MQPYGLTHIRLSEYPIRVLVQLFIDFYLLPFSFANYCWKSCVCVCVFIRISFFNFFLIMDIGLRKLRSYLNKMTFFRIWLSRETLLDMENISEKKFAPVLRRYRLNTYFCYLFVSPVYLLFHFCLSLFFFFGCILSHRIKRPSDQLNILAGIRQNIERQKIETTYNRYVIT